MAVQHESYKSREHPRAERGADASPARRQAAFAEIKPNHGQGLVAAGRRRVAAPGPATVVIRDGS